MFVLLILAPPTLVAILLAGGVWRLSRAYRDQYREDCCGLPLDFRKVLSPSSRSKSKRPRTAGRCAPRPVRAVA